MPEPVVGTSGRAVEVAGEEQRRQLGRHLAQLRAAARYTQLRLAPLLHYGRSTVANVEVGRQRVPRRFRLRCDDILATGGQLTAAFDQMRARVLEAAGTR
jgi:DNA-binding XRE family transcriptional regulator